MEIFSPKDCVHWNLHYTLEWTGHYNNQDIDIHRGKIGYKQLIHIGFKGLHIYIREDSIYYKQIIFLSERYDENIIDIVDIIKDILINEDFSFNYTKEITAARQEGFKHGINNERARIRNFLQLNDTN